MPADFQIGRSESGIKVYKKNVKNESYVQMRQYGISDNQDTCVRNLNSSIIGYDPIKRKSELKDYKQ